MSLNSKQEKLKIIITLNDMFDYVDNNEWQKLESEIFDDIVSFDFIGINDNDRITDTLSKKDFSKLLQNFNKDVDASNRIKGEVLVTIKNETEAELFTTATIVHFKKNSEKGSTREFVGNYQLTFSKRNESWKLSNFIYELKHKAGNQDLE